MAWLLYLIGLVLVVAVLTALLGKVMGRGEIMPEIAATESVKAFNADALAREAYEDIRFDTVLRGYRQDQVDAVIDDLLAQLNQLRAGQAGLREESSGGVA